MQLTLLVHQGYLRQRFKDAFLLPWEQFRTAHHDTITDLARQNLLFGEAQYEASHMWDRLPLTTPVVTFDAALAALREMPGQVLFMSDDEKVDGSSLRYNGEDIPCFIAEANAEELAQQIEFEWYEDYRLAALMMYGPKAMLPADLYIFDNSMRWLLVFTHETTDWDAELDEPMKAAASRVCFLWKKDDSAMH